MKRVILTSLPYWSPIIPPSGLASLKSYLEQKDYKVQIIDLNVKTESLQFYYDFFDVLKKAIPTDKRGTFFNIGHEVLRTFLMLHLYCEEENDYRNVGKKIISKWFFENVEDLIIDEIKKIISDYLIILKEYTKFLVEYYDPFAIGASVYKTNIPLTLFFYKYVKSFKKDIKTLVGGGAFVDFHAIRSENFETLLDISGDYIDKIFIGPGERLLHSYLEGNLPEDQRYYVNSERHQDKDEEFFRLFDNSDFNMRKYSHLAATTSVSCPFKCSFCNEFEFWGNYRKRPIDVVVKEMETLYKYHRRVLFFMTDSLLNPTVDELSEKIIEKKLPFFYDTYFRIDNASTKLENTLKWRNGGLYRVRIGIESGSPKMLELMNKKISIEQIKAALTSLANAGIKTTTYWVIGHPDETEEDFQMTLDLIEEMKNNIWQAECNVFQYFYSGGQNSDDAWAEKRIPLYTDEEIKYLKFNEWELDIYPKRDIIFERMHRFISHCKKLGIPNPYSSYEHWDADERWRKIHKNAVPALEMVVEQDTDLSPCEIKVMAAQSSLINDEETFNF